ncbi:hypothetical protein [Paenibacillus sp. F4]|uniref:hypothetical protein n=1 Tax=Paenibacillus sp. F4 TaxID=357385 RepID=UPI000C9ED7D0|nr:hypothetical protein [Paenibacillus sp. F4]PNQ82691.1 hypothetical protein C1T21_00720 [Paenibacillus sp. F4]
MSDETNVSVGATEEEDKKAAAENQKKAADLEKKLESQIAREEKDYKKQLAKMKKVTMTIPEDPNNPDDVVPVVWNGIVYTIPRGVEVEVPEVIRDIWRESYTKTQEVNKRIRESVKKELKIN